MSTPGEGATMTGSGAPVGVVSPHLDDAVLSCGQLLWAHPGSEVVTVFSSGPSRIDPLPDWDRMSGLFEPGDDVMAVRRGEDDDALALVHGTAHRLGFWDGQYRALPAGRLARLRPQALRAVRARLDPQRLPRSVCERLCEAISGLDLETWFIPLGLHHGDHELVGTVCLDVASKLPDRVWTVYEDLPYRVEYPTDVARALDRVKRKGFALEEVSVDLDEDLENKRKLIACHRSQLAPIGERVDIAARGPETYHRLTRLADTVPG